MMSVVKSTGTRLGLAYDFDRVQHTSTFLAHQLLHHAKAGGRQLPMLDVLFSAFFEGGRDLRRLDELVGLGAEVGLDAAHTRTALETGRYADAVRADRELGATYGVAKIPTYVMAGQPPIHAPGDRVSRRGAAPGSGRCPALTGGSRPPVSAQ